MRLRVCMVLVLLLNGVPGSLVGDSDMCVTQDVFATVSTRATRRSSCVVGREAV